MVLDRHVLAFHDADFAEVFAERGYIVRAGIGGPVSDKPDHRHRRLLRARREWPRCGAADYRDELATFHLTEGRQRLEPTSTWQDIELARISQEVTDRFCVACY